MAFSSYRTGVGLFFAGALFLAGCATPNNDGIDGLALGTDGGLSFTNPPDPQQGANNPPPGTSDGTGGAGDGAGGYPSADTGGTSGDGTGGYSYDGTGGTTYGTGGTTYGTGGAASGAGGLDLSTLFPPPPPVVDAGACGNMACFDVFDCAIFHPGNTCAFTQCVGFICKK